ncbi:MAG: PhzF family phenazine biosynthesis protein [Planctomycetota bacterium]|nr:PhzF family phenazine biosynthesis protein [Planctomycetota bacterium]
MSITIHQVDAFTAVPFRGNPAAVCVLERAASAEWMQAVAAEMNLSETAFLHRAGESWRLRWFTPEVEVELCGHATLASAHVLWETNAAPRSDALLFQTLSGALGARFVEGRIELDFPAKIVVEDTPPIGLIDALGVRPLFVGRNVFDWLVEVASEAEVRACTPDFGRLKRADARGVIVTAHSSDARFDFASRFFAPAVGIDEDPVTGSAHCALAPFWARKLGRNKLTAFQASRRGGVLMLEARGDRVGIGGHAVTVLTGTLHSDPT